MLIYPNYSLLHILEAINLCSNVDIDVLLNDSALKDAESWEETLSHWINISACSAYSRSFEQHPQTEQVPRLLLLTCPGALEPLRLDTDSSRFPHGLPTLSRFRLATALASSPYFLALIKQFKKVLFYLWLTLIDWVFVVIILLRLISPRSYQHRITFVNAFDIIWSQSLFILFSIANM